MHIPALCRPAAIVIVLCNCLGGSHGLADTTQTLTFEQHIRPILKARCFHCHGEEQELHGGLDVRLVRLMQQGGDSGPVIVPGEPDQSLLWERIATDEMPEGPKKLSDEEKNTIQQWLRQGAHTARPEPEDVADARFSHEELSHWAWQPVVPVEPPQPDEFTITNPIDGFIARRLQQHDLHFSPAADRRTLLRRLSFDLTGLPPAPEDVERFVANESDHAWEAQIERLLASPEHGVHWGRHWLDVAGYAETDGTDIRDTPRPHAWRYRDYVIDAFNTNKAIDEFLVEQVAGDELIEGDIDLNNDRHQELLTATGFLRMAPDKTQSSNTVEDRNNTAADSLKVVSSTLLGLTVGCAQCHDHKYDPIGIDDYYQLRAVFAPVFPLQNWQQPGSRLVDFTPDDIRTARAVLKAECDQLEAEVNERRTTLSTTIFEARLADVPEDDRAATRVAVETAEDQRTDEQRRLLDLYPMIKPISFISGFLVEYDNKSYRAFQKEFEQIAARRNAGPLAHLVMTTQEQANVVPASHVFHRGNPNSPGQEVQPAEITVLNGGRNVALPVNDEKQTTTGRRLAWARQLTDGSHPLAARVFVNRVWMHHFGRGLVATPGDFGISGERPSHPELLDWLAHDFVTHGWDLKRLHRQILTSTTWQQSSRRTPQLNQLDPDNRLLARVSLRRLPSESIRDALLFVCDQLSDEQGGPSTPVTKNSEGKVVQGKRLVRDGIPGGVDDADADTARRSVYMEVKRELPLNMLATFDQPEMTPNCEMRHSTTVATQALWFLNDAEIVDHSEQLATRLTELYEHRVDQIEHLFLKLFARPPTEADVQVVADYLVAQTAEFENQPADESQPPAEHRALATLCQSLLASNRFLYVE